MDDINPKLKPLIHAYLFSYILTVLLAMFYDYLRFILGIGIEYLPSEPPSIVFDVSILIAPVLLPIFPLYASFVFPVYLLAIPLFVYVLHILYKNTTMPPLKKTILMTTLFMIWNSVGFYSFTQALPFLVA